MAPGCAHPAAPDHPSAAHRKRRSPHTYAWGPRMASSERTARAICERTSQALVCKEAGSQPKKVRQNALSKTTWQVRRLCARTHNRGNSISNATCTLPNAIGEVAPTVHTLPKKTRRSRARVKSRDLILREDLMALREDTQPPLPILTEVMRLNCQ